MSNDPFDEKAATWDDDPAKVARAREVAQRIVAAVPLTASTRLLDYGAGTGLLAQALRPFVGPITLADTSAGMRGVIDQKVADGLLGDARAWDLDLAAGEPPDERFDLVTALLVLHHVTDLDRVLRGFHTLLAPGGCLCIADLDREDGSFHGEGFAGHHGFERAVLVERLVEAGFASVAMHDGGELVRDGVPYSMFLAVARGLPF